MAGEIQPGVRIVPDSDTNIPLQNGDTKITPLKGDSEEPAPVPGPAPAVDPAPAARPSQPPPSRCQYCGAVKGTKSGQEGTESGGTGRDDHVTKTLEASLPADQALQLRHLVRRLRDERWHAMQAAQDDRDNVLRVKASLKATREDVKALNLALNKVRRAARALQVTTTKDMKTLADHFRRVVTTLIAGVREREKQHKEGTGVDKLEALIAGLREEADHQLKRLTVQGEEVNRLSDENKQLSKNNEKQQIIYKSREQVSKQKITSLENELASLQKEREKIQRDLRTATRSLDRHQTAQQQSQNASDQLEECKLNLEKVRLNLENAVRERNLFKDKLNKAKEEQDTNLKQIEAHLIKARGDQEGKHKDALLKLERQLESEKDQHKDILAQYIEDFRKNEAVHAEKSKKKHEKAQQKIKELEEELQRLTQTSHERETVLKERLEEMRASLKPDTKPKGEKYCNRNTPNPQYFPLLTSDNGKGNDSQEFKVEIERLNSLVAKECEERLELRQALEDARTELLQIKGLPRGPYGGGSLTSRQLTNDVTASYDTFRERSLYKSTWTSEPSLFNPGAAKQDPSPGQKPGVKKVLHSNYAQAVSTEDLYAETADKAHFLPPISSKAPRKSLDNLSSLEENGIAAFHPHKEGFRIPKPMDYLRNHQNVDARQKQQQQMVNRIFKSNAVTSAASNNGHQRATLKPLPEQDSHAQRTLAPVLSETEPLPGVSRSNGRLTVRIPYSTDETMYSRPGTNSPYVPYNTPVSTAPTEQFVNQPLGGVSMENGTHYTQHVISEDGKNPGAINVTTSDPGKVKTRKTVMDYDFSTSKSTEIAYGSRNRMPDSGDARRRVMQLLNEKEEKGKNSYMWGY